MNETNILNLIAKKPALPEPSFQVSHLEQSDYERFDYLLQSKVDTPKYEPQFDSSRPTDSKNSTDPYATRSESPVTHDKETAPANHATGRNDVPHGAKTQPSERTAPLRETPPAHTARSEQTNPNTSPIPATAVTDELAAIDRHPFSDLAHNPQAAQVSDAVADLLATLEVNDSGDAALDTFRQQLAGLNIDAETIDRLVDALQTGDAAGLQGILNALRGLLQAAQAPVSEIAQDVAANRLNPPAQRAIDLLVQAGLSREEAQQVIQQVRAGSTGQPSTENSAQLTKTFAEAIAGRVNAAGTGDTGTSHHSGGDSKGSADNSSGTTRSFSGLTSDRLETLSSLLSPDKSANPGNAQTNPLIAKAATSPLLNTTGTPPALGIQAEGAPGQAPAALADAAAKGVDFAKPAITETYNGRASMDKPITAQIIEKFTLRGFGNRREIHIKLDPPSLGTVRMSVSTSGDAVRATIVAENNVVKAVIESNLSQLKDSITHQGVKIEHFSVLVGGDASHSAHSHKEALDYFGQLRQAGSPIEEPGETRVTFNRPVFLDENQSISIFA